MALVGVVGPDFAGVVGLLLTLDDDRAEVAAGLLADADNGRADCLTGVFTGGGAVFAIFDGDEADIGRLADEAVLDVAGFIEVCVAEERGFWTSVGEANRCEAVLGFLATVTGLVLADDIGVLRGPEEVGLLGDW